MLGSRDLAGALGRSSLDLLNTFWWAFQGNAGDVAVSSRPERLGRIAVAMSGGVDSSVAAALLVEQGYEVVGVTMQLWDEPTVDGHKRPCCTLDDFLDAGRTARKLGIEFEVLDLREEFRAAVVEPFIDEYLQGRTPNPCIVCNEVMKFQVLLERVRQLGASALATGHYARILNDETGRFELHRGIDANKDQSYFLFSLTPEQLSRTLFPLGGLTKNEVRRLAREHGLQVAEKKESQEICFVAGGDYAAFIEKERGPLDLGGAIVDRQGRVLGCHAGTHQFTIGQRRGLGLTAPHPLYVIALDPVERTVTVGGAEELNSAGVVVNRVNWIVPPLTESFSAVCQVRYRQAPLPCSAQMLPDRRLEVRFSRPLGAVAPGQALVLFEGERVLGGGWIESVFE